MGYKEQLLEDQKRIEEWLSQCFVGRAPHADLYDAMTYSLLAGGKRIRPILTIEACRLCGGDVEAVLPFACAVEMVHTYSLIHDDLPCMDNDDLRRGRPTNHKVYGEATAVLAGDGLLTAAFETMTRHAAAFPPERVVEAIDCLARGAGPAGMVGGQALDMAGEGRALTMSEIKELQALKTGALITASAEIGCILAGAGEKQRLAVREYAAGIGLAFQVRDDILDVEGDEQALGKPVGSDAASEKTTFVTIKGVESCRVMVQELTERAICALESCQGSGFLCWLAELLAGRNV
jgi:geranylgeranyl diphosphate synthase type II